MAVFDGKEKYIFVSYAHKDSDMVYPIIESLKRAHFRVWHDERLQQGENYHEDIAEHIADSTTVLIFLSEASANSPYCKREIEYAVSCQKKLAVVYLEENIPLSRGTQLLLNSIQSLSYSAYSDRNAFQEALCRIPSLRICAEEESAYFLAEGQNTPSNAKRPSSRSTDSEKIQDTLPPPKQQSARPRMTKGKVAAGIGAGIGAGLIAMAIGLLLAIILGIVFLVNGIQNKKDARYSADNVTISITDKVETDEKSSYTDGYITAFEFKIKNEGTLEISNIIGQLIVYNAEGTELDRSTCTFYCDLPAGQENIYRLLLDRKNSKKVLELHYADLEDLSATFQLSEISYENKETKKYRTKHVAVLDLDVDSDGVSTTEKAYQQAMQLYNQGNYMQAMEIFASLGYYKDSAERADECALKTELGSHEKTYQEAVHFMNEGKYAEAIECFSSIIDYKDSYTKIGEVIDAGLLKTNALADEGKYDEAYSVILTLSHDAFEHRLSDLRNALLAAKEGYYSEAVEYGLTTIFLHAGPDTVPANYFAGTAVQKIVLPSTIRYIGAAAFYDCTELVEINFPEGLLTIGNRAFEGCTSLQTIVLPDSVTSIGTSAFAECGITELRFSKKLSSLGPYAFSDCNSLSAVTSPGNVTTVSNNTFDGCDSLSAVTVESGVQEIASNAFSRCPLLTEVSLPETLVSMNESAFEACTTLTEIVIPKNVTQIGRYAFRGCSALKKVYFVNTVGWTTAALFSPATQKYIIIDVTDAEQNATRFKSVQKYCNAAWMIE